MACMAFVFTVIFTLASVSTHVAYEGFPGLRSFFENRIQHDSNPFEKASDDEISDNNDEEQSNPSNTQPEPEIKSGFLIDPERYYKLTDEEESKLFFLDGSYKITNWTDTDAIVNQLYPFVEELLAPQTENLFDKDAPDDVKDDISDVSNLEKIMTNSNDLDKIIEKRIEVWGSNYKKYGIAFLLANNMQHYANEYTIIDGAYETIKYYHAQSIFWTWDSLAFKYVTPHMLKDGLNYISARYHDIADQAAKGSEEEIYALALYEAFRILKNMDFTLSDKQQIE